MSNVQSLRVKKKITAFLADGTQKMNLGIPAATNLIAGQDRVAIQIDKADPEAMALLTELATASSATLQETADAFELAFNTAQDDQPSQEPAALETTSPAPDAPVADTPAPTVAATEAPVAPTNDAGETAVTPSDNKPKRAYIILGPQDIYTEARLALRDFARSSGKEVLPANYHNRLTKTFLDGNPAGQIKSLFKDLKRFGYAAIAAKLADYATQILERDWAATDPASDYVNYVAWYKKGLLPHDEATFAQGRADMGYFKFWAILTLAQNKGEVPNA